MKVVINPKYNHLRDWINQLPFSFGQEGKVIYKSRNEVKVFAPGNGTLLNVKRYKKPHPFNRFIYSFFRKSKAFRAYHNTLKIAGKGFDTAEAVAYIEIAEKGLFSDSYFVSLHCRNVRTIREYYSGPLSGNETLIDAFSRYTASLHDAGIFHLDYSPGNVLIHTEKENHTFILIDINRMKFMPVSFDRGCRNFARIFDDDEIYARIGSVYCKSRKNGFSESESIQLIMKYKNSFWRKKQRKKRIKKLLK